MRRRWTVTLVVAVLAAIAPLGHAAVSSPDTSASYAAAAVADRAAAEKRGADQDANPAYHRLMAPLLAQYAAAQVSGSADPEILLDPFLAGWTGTIRPLAFVNRYGATLRGSFYVPRLPWRDPVTGRRTSRGLPGLLFLPGLGSDDSAYRGMLEQLADAGYVVAYVAPQGQAGSDRDPRPKSTYCDPHGSWRRPQEDGLREQGRCAGYDGTADSRVPLERTLDAPFDRSGVGEGNPVGGTVDLVGLEADLAVARTTGNWSEVFDALAVGFRAFRTRYAFAAFDAAAWLRSAADPMRGLMDVDRLGIVGHSAGSDAAVVAGNGDPRHRFRAAVAWDDWGIPPASIHPGIPTLMFQTEQQQYAGPWIPRPDPRLLPAYRVADRFGSTRVPFGVLALRGSTHHEWSYIPYSANDPEAVHFNSNGVAGEVALHETVAWFDRFLKTGPDARVADTRLWQRVLDRSTDASSRGQGSWDLVTQRNVPYTAGMTDLGRDLSRIFASELRLDGRTCPDWQRGC